jgi:hypothetical protein
MNSIDRKILRCQREIEASRPKVMSFEEFEKGAFPYPPVLYGGITTYRFDKLDETTPPIEELSRPADAPKELVVGKVYFVRLCNGTFFCKRMDGGWGGACKAALDAASWKKVYRPDAGPAGRLPHPIREATEAELRGEP